MKQVSVATTGGLASAISRAKRQPHAPKVIVLKPGVYDVSKVAWPTTISGITIVGRTRAHRR